MKPRQPSVQITLHLATPDELKSAGEDLEITWGVSDCPFGNMMAAQSPKGITHLSFFDSDESESLQLISKDWPCAVLKRNNSSARKLLKQIFQKDLQISIPIHLKGSAFQLSIWRALLEIPLGEFRSYNDLANQIAKPGSARAVGNAIGSNRVAYLIPCHRVIRANGSLGGYRWGTERKEALISWEQTQIAINS